MTWKCILSFYFSKSNFWLTINLSFLFGQSSSSRGSCMQDIKSQCQKTWSRLIQHTCTEYYYLFFVEIHHLPTCNPHADSYLRTFYGWANQWKIIQYSITPFVWVLQFICVIQDHYPVLFPWPCSYFVALAGNNPSLGAGRKKLIYTYTAAPLLIIKLWCPNDFDHYLLWSPRGRAIKWKAVC